MVLISLESTNDKLGFIIKKNPTSGMIKRETHSTEFSGYYDATNPNKYIIVIPVLPPPPPSPPNPTIGA